MSEIQKGGLYLTMKKLLERRAFTYWVRAIGFLYMLFIQSAFYKQTDFPRILFVILTVLAALCITFRMQS